MFWDGEGEATQPTASVILHEWGEIQGISRAEKVDVMPCSAAAAVGEGRSSHPQSLSKALTCPPAPSHGSVDKPFKSSSALEKKYLTSLAKRT